MKDAKKPYLRNKIKIYQIALPDRILAIFSTVFLIMLPILALTIPLYTNTKELLLCIILLLTMVLLAIGTYFMVFNTYLCLDIEKQKFVVKEMVDFSKKEFAIKDILRIEISEDILNNGVFSINLVFSSHTQRIYSWSIGRGSLPIIENRKNQRNRLEIFAKECNDALNLYNNR